MTDEAGPTSVPPSVPPSAGRDPAGTGAGGTAARAAVPTVAVGQMGAPTAVVNATVAGFVDAARPRFRVLGVRGGPQGLLAGAVTDLSAGLPAELVHRAGSFLGGGRHAFTDDDLSAAVATLAHHEVTALALIGGNGTMTLAELLVDQAGRLGHELCVVGVPKTVDNDLTGCDHTPGFASAARYLSLIVPELARDQHAMRSFEPVRIVETMGRDAGWLAAATATVRRDEPDPPHLVLVPEQEFSADAFLGRVEDALARYGWAFVTVAEGAAAELTAGAFQSPSFDRPLLGGVSARLAGLVRERLGVWARGEVLGMTQRCAAFVSPEVDRVEARATGAAAARLLADGVGGVAVALDREPGDPYRARLTTVALADVAGRTRRLPDEWLPEGAGAAAYDAWLAPLVADDRGVSAPVAD